jgi:hypothetical protein
MNDNVEGWPWLPDKCPPDKYFIDFMKAQTEAGNLRSKTILHMGTGLHHRVGIECVALGHRVIGLTVSREEVISRVTRVDSPNYQVFYSSLNDLDAALLPPLDIVTLFHFGEMPSTFGPATGAELARLHDRMKAGGLFLFYNRSAEWGNAKPVVDAFVDGGVIKHVGTYEELEVYQCQP